MTGQYLAMSGSATDEGAGASLRQVCTFRLGDLFFGIDILSVDEAVHDKALTKVPLASPVMAGVLNLRGRILCVIDLRARLGLPPAETTPGRRPPHLVVRTQLGEVSLVVDRLEGVVDVSTTPHDTTPAHLDPALRELVSAVYKFDKELLLILDIDRTVQI